MALVRSVATVGGFTAASRVLGFIRDILMANVLGTGLVADAFFVAFRLPNLFRRIFGEGAFNAAFVPLFARRLEGEGNAAARRFAEESLALLLAATLIFTALAMAAMPWLMYVLAPGFAGEPEKFALAVDLTRITFPYLVFMALAALLSAVLNALYRFAAAAAAPILLNIFFIVTLGGIAPFLDGLGAALAWTVTAAGAAQFLLLVRASAKAGMPLSLPRPRLTPGVKRLLKLMVPGLLSAGALQFNLLVGTMIASLQAGAVSYLYYADRVYQLPLGLIGIAFGVVLLPDLSRKLRSGHAADAMTSLNRGIELALLMTLPAAAALIVIAWPIVVALFEHGRFDRLASDATAAALAAYGLGLPAFVLVKILQTAFYAREDTATPLRYALVSVVVNLALSLLLFFAFEALGLYPHLGLAIATSVAAVVNAGLLFKGLGDRGHISLDGRSRQRLPRTALASLLMAAAIWLLARPLLPWFDDGKLGQALALAVLVTSGILVYGALVWALGAMSPGEIKRLLARGRS